MTGHRKTVSFISLRPSLFRQQAVSLFHQIQWRECTCLRASPFVCLVRFARCTKKKERLLVVYSLFPKRSQQEHDGHYYQSGNLIWGRQRRRQPLSCSPFDLSALSSPAKPWLDWLKREFLQRVWRWEIFLHAWMSGIFVLANCFAMAIVFVDQVWITSLWASCGSCWPCID